MTISFTGIRDSRSALRTEIPSGHSFSATSTLPCGCASLLESQLTLALVAGILRAVVRMYVRQMLVMHQALLTFLLSEFSEIDVFLIHNSAVGLVRNSFYRIVTRNPYARRETKCHTGDAAGKFPSVMADAGFERPRVILVCICLVCRLPLAPEMDAIDTSITESSIRITTLDCSKW